MKHKIATVINYCSNEFRFLEHCIKQAEKFSRQIIITVSDCFFDGSKENIKELNYIFSNFSNCIFLYYPYFLPLVPKKLIKQIGDNFCCTFTRLLGWAYLSKEIEYVFFLDADEIVEANKFLQFLDNFDYKSYDAIKLSNYWYFREDKYRAKYYEDSCVLARKAALSRKKLLQEGDRFAAFNNVKGKTISKVNGCDDLPFIHHYSWVRTKKEMLKKVTTWGHKKERDWVDLVEREFLKEFSGKDFVHGYSFDEVKPVFNIDLNLKPKTSFEGKNYNIERVTFKDIYKILGKGIYGFFSLNPPLKDLNKLNSS
jgi:hypothetical protein